MDIYFLRKIFLVTFCENLKKFYIIWYKYQLHHPINCGNYGCLVWRKRKKNSGKNSPGNFSRRLLPASLLLTAKFLMLVLSIPIQTSDKKQEKKEEEMFKRFFATSIRIISQTNTSKILWK